MSRENIEVVQAAIEAWTRGDWNTLREMYDPDIFMRMAEGWPERGPFLGRDAVLSEMRGMRETLEDSTVDTTSDFIDSGDRVLVRVAWRGAGRGPRMTMEATTINTVR